MVVMLDVAGDLKNYEAEIGLPVERLLTPRGRTRLQPNCSFAIDNGAFTSFNSAAFERLLERYQERRKQCRFVALPDVVGSARRTLEAFAHWRPKVSDWKVALVAQDGQERLPIPWDAIDAIFIGGTTDWKLSHHAARIIQAGKICGKWVHVGRVNTATRFAHFVRLGVDSIDGSGLSRYSWMRKQLAAKVTAKTLF